MKITTLDFDIVHGQAMWEFHEEKNGLLLDDQRLFTTEPLYLAFNLNIKTIAEHIKTTVL